MAAAVTNWSLDALSFKAAAKTSLSRPGSMVGWLRNLRPWRKPGTVTTQTQSLDLGNQLSWRLGMMPKELGPAPPGRAGGPDQQKRQAQRAARGGRLGLQGLAGGRLED